MGSLLLASGCMATVTPGRTRVTYLVPRAPIRHQTTVYVRPGSVMRPHTSRRVIGPAKHVHPGPAMAHRHTRSKHIPVYVPGAATLNSPQLRFW